LKGNRALAEQARKSQDAGRALLDTITGTPVTVSILATAAGAVGVQDDKLPAGTVADALAAIGEKIGAAAAAQLARVVSGQATDSYPNEARAKEIGKTKPVPVTAK